MAKGEKRWSGSGDTVKRSFTPVPPKDWEAKLDAGALEVAVGAAEKGALPYVKGLRFTCLNSAEQEGGKDRKIFINYLACSLKEDKTGNPMTNYANQIRGLMKALGDVRDMPVKSKEFNGDIIEYLDPKAVIAYLKEHDGDIVGLHSKLEKRDDGSRQAAVDFFAEAEESGESEEETEEAEEADEEADEAEEVSDDEDEDEDEEEPEEEEEPAPAKKAAKPAAKKGKKR